MREKIITELNYCDNLTLKAIYNALVRINHGNSKKGNNKPGREHTKRRIFGVASKFSNR